MPQKTPRSTPQPSQKSGPTLVYDLPYDPLQDKTVAEHIRKDIVRLNTLFTELEGRDGVDLTQPAIMYREARDALSRGFDKLAQDLLHDVDKKVNDRLVQAKHTSGNQPSAA